MLQPDELTTPAMLLAAGDVELSTTLVAHSNGHLLAYVVGHLGIASVHTRSSSVARLSCFMNELSRAQTYVMCTLYFSS